MQEQANGNNPRPFEKQQNKVKSNSKPTMQRVEVYTTPAGVKDWCCQKVV